MGARVLLQVRRSRAHEEHDGAAGLNIRRAPLAAVAATFALALAHATTTSAATLTVDTTSDSGSAAGGLCSLRAALAAVDAPGAAARGCAPAAFGPNTIVLPAGTYRLSASGELEVTGDVTNLTILGASEHGTRIVGTGDGRVLQVLAGAIAALRNVTISGGFAGAGAAGAIGPGGGRSGNGGPGGPGGAGAEGGGILNQGSLTLTDVEVSANQAGSGGAGGIGGSATDGAGGIGGAGGVGGAGGGIFNAGQLTLEGVTLALDHAGAGGAGGVGGVGGNGRGGRGGIGGAAGVGAGIANEAGTIAVLDSTIRGNGSPAGGSGGAGGQGTAEGGRGGEGAAGGSGAGLWSSGRAITIADSTFASNGAGAGGSGGTGGNGNRGGGGGPGGAGGGAAALSAPDTTLLNDTVVGNSPGAGAAGGIAGNGAEAGSAGLPGPAGSVGAVSGAPLAPLTLENTLLALNGGGNCGFFALDGGHNLSFGAGGCPATFSSADPLLGPLRDNGGPTETISLERGSSAIDQVPAHGAGCPASDQRRVPRPQGPACDIGAYESARAGASTGPAKRIGSTSAFVSAIVIPYAAVARVSFQYGLTRSYGHHTRARVVTGVSRLLLSARLAHLKPESAYHYRVIVASIGGRAIGRDRTFRTR